MSDINVLHITYSMKFHGHKTNTVWYAHLKRVRRLILAQNIYPAGVTVFTTVPGFRARHTLRVISCCGINKQNINGEYDLRNRIFVVTFLQKH